METTDLMSTLKWAELASIEEYLDLPMDEWANTSSKAKLAFAMQYMMAKRNNPSLTIEQAEEMSITQLTELSGMDVTVPKEVPSA
jgi:hypothetical protein